MTPCSTNKLIGMFGVCGVLWIALASTWAQDPSVLKTQSPTAYLKALGKEEAVQVNGLRQTIKQLGRSGKFAEAVGPAAQVLKIHEKSLGFADWRTADARREIETLRLIATLPEADRKALASVDTLQNQFAAMAQEGRFAEAERVARELLIVREHRLGPNHRDTADSYNALASMLHAKGDYAAAEEYFRKTLAISLKTLGAGHPDTAPLSTTSATTWTPKASSPKPRSASGRLLQFESRP